MSGTVLPAPRFEIGQKVWMGHTATSTSRVACPGCGAAGEEAEEGDSDGD